MSHGEGQMIQPEGNVLCGLEVSAHMFSEVPLFALRVRLRGWFSKENPTGVPEDFGILGGRRGSEKAGEKDFGRRSELGSQPPSGIYVDEG